RDDGVREVLEDSAGTDAKPYELAGEVSLRPVDVRRSLGRDVNSRLGTAVDVDAAPVAVDMAVAELLDEDERHLRQVLVEVDRAVDVQRGPLVVMLDPCRPAI